MWTSVDFLRDPGASCLLNVFSPKSYSPIPKSAKFQCCSEASGRVPDGSSQPQMTQTQRILCGDNVRTHLRHPGLFQRPWDPQWTPIYAPKRHKVSYVTLGYIVGGALGVPWSNGQWGDVSYHPKWVLT